jgi:hypothetical protein
MKKDLMKKMFDNIYVDAFENHTKRILKHALVAWHSGHPIRLQNRRSGFEFRQGERLMKKDLMKNMFDIIYVDAFENHRKRILKHALVAWRSGHPVRLQNR